MVLAEQLSIYDEFDRGEPLRRLGAGPELGAVLLLPLAAKGWHLHEPVRAFAGQGNLYILERAGIELRRVGASLGEVAVDLFEEAARYTPVGRG